MGGVVGVGGDAGRALLPDQPARRVVGEGPGAVRPRGGDQLAGGVVAVAGDAPVAVHLGHPAGGVAHEGGWPGRRRPGLRVGPDEAVSVDVPAAVDAPGPQRDEAPAGVAVEVDSAGRRRYGDDPTGGVAVPPGDRGVADPPADHQPVAVVVPPGGAAVDVEAGQPPAPGPAEREGPVAGGLVDQPGPAHPVVVEHDDLAAVDQDVGGPATGIPIHSTTAPRGQPMADSPPGRSRSRRVVRPRASVWATGRRIGS